MKKNIEVCLGAVFYCDDSFTTEDLQKRETELLSQFLGSNIIFRVEKENGYYYDDDPSYYLNAYISREETDEEEKEREDAFNTQAEIYKKQRAEQYEKLKKEFEP